MGVQALPIAGEWREAATALDVRSPFDQTLVDRVGVPEGGDVEDALKAAEEARSPLQALHAWERSERLQRASERIAGRVEELARTIAREAGKPIREARGEASRAVYVFRWAAEEAKRMDGEWIPLDTEPGLGRRAGLVRRFPIGPVLAISPFNFPLNLVAHKVAPALAAGNPVLIKPSTRTPLSALALAEILLEDDWPPGTVSVLPVDGPTTARLAEDRRIRGISFTGSDRVGWALKAANPKKKVTLELGGNAAVLVEPDADLPFAAERLTFGSFAYAGQVCLSTQRILVAEDVREAFLGEFLPRVERLRMGDPLDDRTDVGPMISAEALGRVDDWVVEAQEMGASVLVGGGRSDPFYRPTVLADVPEASRCWREEIFGPVVSVVGYRDFSEGLRLANATRYGLQSAIFTHDLTKALGAQEWIEAGGVIVNDAPFFRAVQMPYGGSRDSGYGREGIRWTM
ncbi:MAG TPA: aldehyde dehydrogenase family protein, partial [Actinomycetota bacterium]